MVLNVGPQQWWIDQYGPPQRSVRFNSADSAYLSRTPASAGNRKTWTWAGWVKKSAIGSGIFTLFSAGNSSTINTNWFGFVNNTFLFALTDGTYLIESSSLYRDPSSWYHVVAVYDSNNATSSDRIRIFVNGNRLTEFSSSSYPTPGYDGFINNNTIHGVGVRQRNGFDNYFDGYLADIHFIDGAALDPTSFGEFDSNGIWQHKAYTGSYGTNGFHLPFSDNSTAAALGTDTSGNGNDWTVNNLSVLNGNGSYVGSTSGSFYSPFNDPYTVFDGVLAAPNGLYVYSNMTGRLTFTTPLSGVIEVYASNGSNSNTDPANEDVIALSDGSTVDVSGVLYTNRDWFSFGSKTNISWIELRHNDTTGQGTFLFGIRVNGVVLIDNKFSAGNDSLVDSPTNGLQADTGVGGEVVGNYCTFNPLTLYASPSTSISEGNLKVVKSGNTVSGLNATFGFTDSDSGKYYFEAYHETGATIGQGIGWGNDVYFTYQYGKGFTKKIHYLNTSCTFSDFGVGNTSIGTGLTSNFGAILGVALDIDNNELKFYVNNVLQATATGVWGTYFSSGEKIFPCLYGNGTNNNGTVTFNFGQRPFAYTAPSGFKALCTANLPTPTIEKGSDYFDTTLYTGNGSTQTISGLDFSPDLVWLKARSSGGSSFTNHVLVDAVRGSGTYGLKNLYSNTTEDEYDPTSTSAASVTALNSDGFALGGNANTNTNTMSAVAWCWDAGTAANQKTYGPVGSGADIENAVYSITSTVRANASAGFSIVTYTGNGTNNATVGHGLGVTPSFVIVKSRDGNQEWIVYHSDLTPNKNLILNLTLAESSWNEGYITLPTSTTFRLTGGPNLDNINTNTHKHVAYCFAPVEGYSAFGSYIGNGSTDGPFVYTGFRPRWLIIKCSTDSTSPDDWFIYDTERDDYNPVSKFLSANYSGAEQVRSDPVTVTDQYVDILSNGFKLRNSRGVMNLSAETYIYAAFAENPFSLNVRAR